jgi:hypothetical protein
LPKPLNDASPEISDEAISADPAGTSRRKVLTGIGASLALPLIMPLSWLEGLTAAASLSFARGALAIPAAPRAAVPEPVSTVPQPIPTAVQTVARLNILDSIGTIPDYFMGLSYEKGEFVSDDLFIGSNTALAALFNLLGNGVLSFGGATTDLTLWTPEGVGNTAGQVSPVDIDNLAEFLALTNWKVLYGVNLATSTPALAAAEVAYVQEQLGDRVLGFAIGNEPDEYSLSYFPAGWDLAAFEALWEEFRSAILASTPSAAITGPGSGGDVTTWTVPFFLGPNGKLVSLLTQHYYRGDGYSVNATIAKLIEPDPTIVADCVALKSAVSVQKTPFRFSETNSYFYGGAPGVSNAFASSLWVIDHLFDIALGGGSGVNLHGGDLGYYAPIANSGSTIVEVMPEYYGLLLFALIGQGELMGTHFSNDDFQATFYAVLAPSGATYIVIVNKEVYLSLKLVIDCGRPISGADLIELRSSSLSALTGQTLQGGTVGTDGAFIEGTHYAAENISSQLVTCYVPAISAVLLRVF